MERLIGYDRAIIIDAICGAPYPPGTLLWLNAAAAPTQHSASAHDVDLPTALRLATEMGLKMPQDLTILAITAENVLDFSEELSPAVAAAVPAAVQAVLEHLHMTSRSGDATPLSIQPTTGRRTP